MRADCGWLNNCVGANNLRHFLLFLVMTALLCFYGTAIITEILVNVIRQKRLTVMTFFDPALQVRRRLTWWQIGSYMLATEYALVALDIFMIIIALMLVAFTGYHVYLIAVGTTTNETFRWDDVREVLDAGEPLELPASSPAAAKAVATPTGGSGSAAPDTKTAATAEADRNHAKGAASHRRAGNETSQKAPPNGVVYWTSSKQIINIYNRGMFANLAEVIQPPRYFR